MCDLGSRTVRTYILSNLKSWYWGLRGSDKNFGQKLDAPNAVFLEKAYVLFISEISNSVSDSFVEMVFV